MWHQSGASLPGVLNYPFTIEDGSGKERKWKEEYLYSAFYILCISQSAQAWITPANTPCLPFLRKRSPDGATSNWGKRHPIAAYYSSIDPEGMKRRVGLVGWHIADGLPSYPHKWSPVHNRSSAQGKFAGQRPTFYHCATQPTITLRDYTWFLLGRTSPKIPPSPSWISTPSNNDSLGPPESTPKRYHDRFSRFCRDY